MSFAFPLVLTLARSHVNLPKLLVLYLVYTLGTSFQDLVTFWSQSKKGGKLAHSDSILGVNGVSCPIGV